MYLKLLGILQLAYLHLPPTNMNKPLLLILGLLAIFLNAIAQDKPSIIFNHILPEDFSIAKLKVDTSLGAVIIADIGSSAFEGNIKGWFNLIYKHQRRIKIINKKGYDLATVDIPLYINLKSDQKEKLLKLKASTYNLVNGIVVETKLDNTSLFEENQDKHHLREKFTMPAVKEGSIIEYSYEIKSDFFFNLQHWQFQWQYPTIWSEYEVDIPRFFEYVYLAHGYNTFDIKTAKSKFTHYTVKKKEVSADETTEVLSVTSDNMVSRWVMKNVPALKQEKFTSSINNHISWVEFQLSGEQFPYQPHEDIMGTWVDLSKELIKDADFGQGLDKYNAWLNEDIKQVNMVGLNQLNQAKSVFNYLKTTIKSKGIQYVYLSNALKDIFRTKSGYAQDINLLLTAMLRHLNIDANPVILSTRSNGFAIVKYPLIQRFNYVVCQANIDGENYYLDASEPYMGFNKLPAYCYNGAARVVSLAAPPVYFNADSVKENKLTTVMLFNDDKIPGKWSGAVTEGYTYFESCTARKRALDNGKEVELNKIKEQFIGGYAVEEVKYEDFEDADKPIKLLYTLNINTPGNGGIIYFKPMVKSGYAENIFTAADRKYPVEMPGQQDESYNLHMEIPEGYAVDELPKSAKVSLNNDDGFFEYLISKDDKEINLRSRIKLNKANFLPEDYASLRSFFDFIVKKHAEQIIFKKK